MVKFNSKGMENAQLSTAYLLESIALSLVLPLDPSDHLSKRSGARKTASLPPLFAKMREIDLWRILNTEIRPPKVSEPEEPPTRLRLVTSHWVDKPRGKASKR